MNDERQAFEADFAASNPVALLKRHANGTYDHILVEARWLGWQAARAASPAGYKLVPVEPTLPMLVAGNRASLDVSVLMDDSSHSCERACYAAMLVAAPSQPKAPAAPERLTEGDANRNAHDALPLIERLRNTPNWMRESYGSWKDCVLTYDRSPFEAADELERLRAMLAASPASPAQQPVAWMNPNEGFAPNAFIWGRDEDCHPEYSEPVYRAQPPTPQPPQGAQQEP
jgi:hypothetical protein